MPQVSVIIPSYNGANYVQQAVDSVLRQTYGASEIIVVDDGSTDATRQVLLPYVRERKISYLYQKNGGPAKARNAGIRAARGRYIAFLDADDRWYPDKLGLQLALLQKDRGLRVVHTRIEVVDRQERILNDVLYDNPVREGWIFEDLLLLRSWIFLSSLFVERSVLDRVGVFNESLPTAEDTNLFIRIAREYRIGYLDRVLVQRRSHGMNMTETGSKNIGTFKNLDDIVNRFPELSPARSTLMRHAYDLRYRMHGCTIFRNGGYVDARYYFRKALGYRKINPAAVAYLAATFIPGKILGMARELKQHLTAVLRVPANSVRSFLW
jgi:glycosyltransferase involved in cell wall biosynthesis